MSTKATVLRRQAKELLLEAEDGAILVFNKRFDWPNLVGKTYTYVAVKADGKWYMTGESAGRSLPWDMLVDFLADGVKRVYAVTEMEQVA